MARELQTLLVELQARDERFAAVLTSVETRLGSFEKSVNATTAKVESGFAKITSTAGKLAGAFGAIGGAYAAIQLGKKVLFDADAFASLQTRIRFATKETGDFNRVSRELFRISQQTGTSLEANVSVFQSLARGAKEIGATNPQILTFVETVQQLGVLGGISTENLNAGLLQLGQALASGKLQGDELKSILENFPPLAKAIADGLGVSVGALRQMGTEGKLTAQLVFPAILSQSQKVKADFESIPPSLARAMSSLGGSVTNVIGQINEKLGITVTLAEKVQSVADAINRASGVQDLTKDIREASREIFALQQQLQTLRDRKTAAGGSVNAAGGDLLSAGRMDLRINDITARLREQRSTLQELQAAYRKTEVDGVKTWTQISQLTDVAATDLIGITGKLTEYASVARGAAVATDELAKAREKATKALTEEIGTLQVELTALQQSRMARLSEAQALAQVKVAQDAARSGDQELAAEKGKLAAEIDKIKEAYRKETQAAEDRKRKQEQEAESTRKAREELQKQLTGLEKQSAIIDKVIGKTIDLKEAQIQLTVAQRAGRGQDNQLLEAITRLEAANKARLESVQDTIDAEKKQAEQRDQALAQQRELESKTKSDIALNERLTRIIEDGIGSRRELRDIEHDLAVEREAARLVTEKYTGDERALAEQIVATGDAFRQSQTDLDEYKRSLEGGIDITSIFRDGVRGLAQNTNNLGSFLKQQGQALAVEFGNAFLFGKQNTLDKGLKLNISQLVGGPSGGLVGAIMGQGGTAAGSVFGNSLLSSLLPNPTQIMTGLKDVLASLSIGGSGLGASLGNLFSGIGNLGSGLIGNSIGSMIGDALGLKGGGLGGSIGGLAGGIAGSFLPIPGGSAIGAALGNLFGSFIEGLFKRVPTKGTQIRKAVVKYLDEIGVSFSDELDRKDYFFKDSKKLAKQLFEGDFLEASKQVLKDKVGPEMAAQLSAIGTFITADLAKDKGKSIEQAGTTFGNMLAANLGTDATQLGNALDEIVQKAGISFDALVEKLNTLARNADISMDFYKEAIAGAITLFETDLPKAIDATKLAAKAMTSEGILDLERYREELQKATSQYETIAAAIGGTIQKRIAENLSGDDTKAAFLQMLKDGLRDAAIQNFLDTEIPKMFEGIDLTEPLNLSSEAVQKLAERAGVAADNMYEILRAAGLLPEELKESVDTSNDLVNNIRKLDDEIAQIATRRVAIRIDLVDRLSQIGSLTSLQAIDLKAQALQTQADSMLRTVEANGGIAGMTIQQLDELLSVQDNLAGLMVDRYNAEAQAIQNSSQAALEQIRSESLAKQAGIQASIQGLNDSKSATQQYFQEIERGLQDQLQTAQAFQGVASQLKNSISQLVTGPQSALSKPEQAAFLERQISSLRSQPMTAEVAQQLGEALQQRLAASTNQQGSVAFFNEFSSVVQELESVQRQVAARGEQAIQIQNQIKQVQMQSLAALSSIDQQIAAQQQELAQLSIDEQYAVQRAQEAINQKLEVLRRATEEALVRNGIQQERIAAEAQAKREEQRRLQFEQLVSQVGVEEATRLVADQNFALLYTMVQVRDVLNNLDATLVKILPAASGFEGVVSRPRLILAGERGPEYVSITPGGAGRSGGTMSINAPLTVYLSGSATEEDGRRLSRGYIEALKYEVRHGDLGTTIKERVR